MFVFWQGQYNQSRQGCRLSRASTDYWRFCYSHTENGGGGGQREKASFYSSHLHLNEVKQLQSFTLKTVFMKLPQGTFQKFDARASVPALKDREVCHSLALTKGFFLLPCSEFCLLVRVEWRVKTGR